MEMLKNLQDQTNSKDLNIKNNLSIENGGSGRWGLDFTLAIETLKNKKKTKNILKKYKYSNKTIFLSFYIQTQINLSLITSHFY